MHTVLVCHPFCLHMMNVFPTGDGTLPHSQPNLSAKDTGFQNARVRG